ncbi:MAG TPA: response regulator [Flavisolibacter sp.]|nr:response regulator [Flavisolibacter sp.]
MPRTIFLAEDDVDDQEFLEDALRSIDPHVRLVSFTSGARFIQHLEKTADDQLPGLIILDYNIPEINGAEILKYLNESSRYNDIHKIIWSTSNSSLYIKTCIDLGAKDYVIKPSSVAGIKEIAEKILGWCKVN